jgi:hypothetical protein
MMVMMMMMMVMVVVMMMMVMNDDDNAHTDTHTALLGATRASFVTADNVVFFVAFSISCCSSSMRACGYSADGHKKRCDVMDMGTRRDTRMDDGRGRCL